VIVRFLLDTNIVSDLVRHPHGRITDHIARVGEQQVGTSIMVAAELRYGAAKKRSSRLSTQLEKILDALEVIPFEAPADAFYGELRARLERTGRVIGANDLLIAAQALALGCIIVTDNEQEFSRVDGLRSRTGCGTDSPESTAGGDRCRPWQACRQTAASSPRGTQQCGQPLVGRSPRRVRYGICCAWPDRDHLSARLDGAPYRTVGARRSALIMSATFSAIMITGALVLPEVMVGMMVGVDHAQARDPAHAQPSVDHGLRMMAC
jgi:tRNA(fMet)-specific endonuclease VapC